MISEDRPMDLEIISKELLDDRHDSEKSPPTTTTMIRKLRIKIKLPEDELEMKNKEEDEEEDAEELQYACSLCGKGFRSRKALGGHMRVHAQQQRRNNDVVVAVQNQLPINNNNASSDDMDANDDANDGTNNKAIRCPICERDFPSNKALFGHMRCHPERTWRGIQPPPPVYSFNNSSSSTVSDVNQPPADDEEDPEVRQKVVDLEKDLLGFGWKGKAIRGRDALNTNSSSSSVPLPPPPAPGLVVFGDLVAVEPEQVDGVHSLILLSQGDSGRRLLQPAVCRVRDNVNNYMMNMKKLKLRGAELKSNHHSGLDETIRGAKRKNCSQGVMLTGDEDRDMTQLPNKKFKVTDDALVRPNGCYNAAAAAAADLFMQTADAKEQMHKVRKYLMVNKDFKAMSDTNSMMLQPPHSSPVTTTTNKSSTSTAIHRQVGNMDHQVERYKCTTCNKCFSSHQALGGHKSSHNKLRNSNNSNTPTVSSKPNSSIDHFESYSNVITQPRGGEAGSSHGDQGLLTMMGEPSSGVIHPLHQCNVCFKIYPSGQALGGHKRLHCTTTTTSSTPLISKFPPQHYSSLPTALHPNIATAGLPSLPLAVPNIVLPVQPPQVADSTPLAPALALAPPAALSPENKGVFRDFNLNEPAPIEDEDYI